MISYIYEQGSFAMLGSSFTAVVEAHLTVFQDDAAHCRVGMRLSEASSCKFQGMPHVLSVIAADDTCCPHDMPRSHSAVPG